MKSLAAATLMVAIVIFATSFVAGARSAGQAGTGVGFGITEAEIPLAWRFSYHIPSSAFSSGPQGLAYYGTAPATHGLFIRKFGSPGDNTTVKVFVADQLVRFMRFEAGSGATGDGPNGVGTGLDAPLLVRPGESFVISTGAGAPEISLDVAFIPASQLPPIPPM